MRFLSRDPFARASVVRREFNAGPTEGCAWCGQRAARAYKRVIRAKLYEYGTFADDQPNPTWDGRRFCSKTCRDTFHS